jgi:hypothetical protein
MPGFWDRVKIRQQAGLHRWLLWHQLEATACAAGADCVPRVLRVSRVWHTICEYAMAKAAVTDG